MISVTPLTDSTLLIGNGPELRKRWDEDGVIFVRGLIDQELMEWARDKYRKALADEGLIDLESDAPVWTGETPKTRRPCDILGTEVWHEIVKQPELNALLRDIFDADPVWVPIACHRSGLPTGPLKENEDIFAGRHQDGFFNEGMQFTTCWMPIRDVDMNSGSFAVAPGTHARGNLHSEDYDDMIPPELLPDSVWRSADFKVGDVLIFNYFTAHAALPNPSNEIRMSLDVRAVPAWAPQPLEGIVAQVEDRSVTIKTVDGDLATVYVTEKTYIRDMNPRPRVPIDELERIAYPGAHVLAMAGKDGKATVLRRNWY